MKIAAIIGADSMLGRAVARQLREQHVTVISIGRASHHDIVLDLVEPPKPELRIDHKADVVFHCAAAFAGDDCGGVRTNLITNTLGCASVLALMVQLECLVCVYAGTVSSIEGADSTSVSSYGLSKAQGEQILQWGTTRKGGTFCSLRFSQLYDAEGLCCTHQPWFGRIIAYASRGLDLRLPPSLGVRNFVHVDDAARLMIRAWTTGLSGTWPLCHTESMDTEHIAKLAYREFNKGGNIIVDSGKTPFRPFYFPECRPLYDLLQDAPEISMSEGLSMIHRAGHAGHFGPMDVQ